ncbi:hypothetical protein A8B82_15140 [Sulfitobacter sp. EhC04]|uniref:hypothetical protein n=1 Tax=Sulfitobacter sp. EhC04 TaxID=1849168 RepID=UPI0007F3F80A|nr:hypothetical protein [Sulfitobacter sp. EhC04]OAN76727.1 hypothetical protein A8B82_15140 [Sulfitobacter sp. EhC04]
MKNHEMKFQERIENGVRRLYAVSFWPKQIRVDPAVASDALYFSEDVLHINCANGSAQYRRVKVEDGIWIGYLTYARGDHPVYPGWGPTE